MNAKSPTSATSTPKTTAAASRGRPGRFCDELADACASTAALLMRYLAGFDDTNHTKQAPGLPNHLAWALGHLALTMHRASERISGTETPLAWNPEPFAFGSTPVADRNAYPRLDELKRRFEEGYKRLTDAIRATGDGALAETVTWGNGTISKRDLAARMVFHNGVHAGQIIDLRRALGMPRLVG